MRSALFVDFDNVYSGLRRLDPSIAERFAREPAAWLRWLADTLRLPPHAPGDGPRRLLVRRCYLNPQVYQRHRPAFNRAGFEIVDCPALTSENKTSTDIHMVLDIVDLLQSETRYDEFIVFSADADFTPVLRKLRRWDRRTTALAIGFPSAAYQASADLLIDPDDFVREALGVDDCDPVAPLADRIVAATPQESAPRAGPATAASERAIAPAPRPEAPVPDAAAVERLIREEVVRAGGAVPCARLAQLIAARHRALAADWNGKGSFRRYVEALDLAPLRFDWNAAGGHLADPASAGPREPNRGDAGAVASRSLPQWGDESPHLPLVSQISQATGMPLLSPTELRAVLQALADEVAEHPFALSETGKRVRDRCRGVGAISRGDVGFVLKGIALGGHVFGGSTDHAGAFAAAFVRSVLALCEREQFTLDDAQRSQLRAWAGLSAREAVTGTLMPAGMAA